MVSNFEFKFREKDPDKRLRVTAIIDKTITEAENKIQKKMFAKHLQNTKKDPKNITDSRKSRIKVTEELRNEYYQRRDELILKETKFSIQEEK